MTFEAEDFVDMRKSLVDSQVDDLAHFRKQSDRQWSQICKLEEKVAQLKGKLKRQGVEHAAATE
eukprot:CAMPEP_0185568718 /NCGR_PEP_ID=MMETSP0434-20130131/1592_1 /TAXON_ID=626734 ORGANISM="Favella taraikaensis, Strain Fe Narragansett Bay" /NCGR_SAMPLE_ID=MMETSP0434 /ASSEMBLY_ACC=CAM_ASM_000379 /LENGTH=63 /DNA_ID=CAMNT_0028183313 /DNA_START=125 /DNA_END=316 /DNA_ORIENTATION=+